MSTVWEDTNGCENKYRCDLDIYLMTLLSSSHGIITDRRTNAPYHGNNVVDGPNETNKHYLKKKMKLIGKLGSNNTTNIGMIPTASYEVSIKLSYQCIHILNNKERLNGLKGIKNTKERITIKISITYIQCSKEI